MRSVFEKLHNPTLSASLRTGGFVGWYFTVMYICEQSLRFYRDDSMLSSVNITFLNWSAITAVVLLSVLLMLDVDGLLSDRLLRWLPGIFMAESGVALSLANASTMTVFSAVSGAASAIGALAVMTSLLRVRVGRRIQAISGGLAIGGAIRLISVLVIGSSPTKTGLIAAAAAIGVVSALTVHSDGGADDDKPMISLAEAGPRTILKKVPPIFIVLLLCSGAFYFANTFVESRALSLMSSSSFSYAIISSAGFIAAAAAAGLLVRLPQTALLFAFGAGLSTAAAILALLPYMTTGEAAVFALLSYAALACVKASFYMIIVTFSLDRPHPIFYAFFGYTTAIIGQLAGLMLDDSARSLSPRSFIWILILLMIAGSGLFALGMKKSGFTREQMDHRHNVSTAIRRRCAQLELSPREQQMTESIVLDGSDLNTLAAKMLFSRNTVRVLLRSLLPKFGVDSIDALREYFKEITEKDERFYAEVQAAADERRAADRIEQSQQRREARVQRRERRAGRRADDSGELLEDSEAAQMMEITLGGDDSDEMTGDMPFSDTADAFFNMDSIAENDIAPVPDDGFEADSSDDDAPEEMNGEKIESNETDAAPENDGAEEDNALSGYFEDELDDAAGDDCDGDCSEEAGRAEDMPALTH